MHSNGTIAQAFLINTPMNSMYMDVIDTNFLFHTVRKMILHVFHDYIMIDCPTGNRGRNKGNLNGDLKKISL